MALDNLISVIFTDSEMETLDAAMHNIASVLKGKAVNLTPDERRQYGRINEENKLLVNKVKTSEEDNPSMHPAFLDFDEFKRDYDAREVLGRRVELLAQLSEMLSDTKILLDFDNYNYSVSYYRYIKMLSTQNIPGSTTLYENLRKVYESQISAAKTARIYNERDRYTESVQPGNDNEVPKG